MAAALLTTLYGALLANIIFIPMADKLGLRSNEEALSKTIIIHGVMSIQSGDNPRTVESKLITFLPPALRPQQVFMRLLPRRNAFFESKKNPTILSGCGVYVVL